MKKYYFLHTRYFDGQYRLNPLSGQTMEDGTAIDASLNVQNADGEKILRELYKNSDFVTDSLTLKGSSNGKDFYKAGHMFPVGIPQTSYQSTNHKPTDEMVQAYQQYKASLSFGNDNLFGFDTPIQNPSPAPKASSLDSLIDKAAGQAKAKETKQKKPLLLELQSDRKLAVPTIEKDSFHVNPEDWWFLLRNIRRIHPTLLTGPAGCGKTELLELAARRLGMTYKRFDMGSIIDPVSSLMGVHRMKGKESVFEEADFMKALKEPTIVHLDEINRCVPAVTNFLMSVCDNRREFRMEIAEGNQRYVKLHPECVIVATANFGDNYVGTNDMDQALLNRFDVMGLDYIPSEIEKNLLIKTYHIPESQATNIVKTAWTVRTLIKKGELQSGTISVRDTKEAASMIEDGFDPAMAMKRIFLPKFEPSMERPVVANSIAVN